MKHFPDIFINLIIPTHKLQTERSIIPEKYRLFLKKNNSYLSHADFPYKKPPGHNAREAFPLDSCFRSSQSYSQVELFCYSILFTN